MDRHLQDKLQQYSAEPPAGLWEKITVALDADKDFAQRLASYEATPPPATWQQIEGALDETIPANVVPFKKRTPNRMRYVAVAAFLAVILVAVSLLVRRTEAGSLPNGTERTVLGNAPTPDPGNSSVAATPSNVPIADSAVFTPYSTDEKINTPPATAVAPPTNKEQDATVNSSMNEYVFFADGDGQMRKVSKKLADFVNCKDNDLPCKQRLKALRQQMAAKAMTTDFTGVIDLLRQMQ